MSTEAFVIALALVGVVIVIAALLSGLVERSGLPQVAVFLLLGVVLGPAGFGLLDITLESPALRIVATLSLTLVLFTDAITIDVAEVRRYGRLVLTVLGPGTLLPAVLIAGAAWWLLGLPPPAAAVLGAALASTDPVLLRGLLRRRDIPNTARQVLQLESGLNDVVLLPVVLVAMAFLGRDVPASALAWARLGVDLLLLGPGAGVVVGLVAIGALDLVRRTAGVSRDYESLYALGIPLTAAAAAEAVHGSGFLAAFAAGLTVAAFDVELCDCFLEYGRATAEMALLLTFVLFGGSLIWSGLTILGGPTLLFAGLALAVRPAVMLGALRATALDGRSRALVTWFGPRGLSSLLLVLLPAFAGLPGSDRLFAITSLVVLISIAVHGVTLPLYMRGRGRVDRTPPPPPTETEPEPVVEPVSRTSVGAEPQSPEPVPQPVAHTSDGHPPDGAGPQPEDSVRISAEELRRLWEHGAPVVVLDVRTDRNYFQGPNHARGAIRLLPDRAARDAAALGLPRLAWLVAYCA